MQNDMITIIAANIVGLLMSFVPTIMWKKKYGGGYIDVQLLALRKKYRQWSLFGMMLFLVATIELGDMLGLFDDNLVWIILPAIFMANNQVFFEPYHRAEVVDGIDRLCLYLRPFKLSFNDNGYISRGIIGIPETVEKMLCGELNKRIARTYCIGDPNSALPTTLSASCIYASDKEWKTIIEVLTEKSRLIVLRVMETEGCMWEMNHCVNKHLDKTIFVITERNHVKLLKDYVVEIGIEVPNVNIQKNECIAVCLNKEHMTWEVTVLKKQRDVVSMVKNYIKSHEGIRQELGRESSFMHTMKGPFRKNEIHSKWTHRLTFFVQTFWYISYNRWPKWWILIFAIYGILILILAGMSLVLCGNILQFALVYMVLFLPWLWLAPRITASFNAWGSQDLMHKGNVILCRWACVYMILVVFFSFLFE